MAAPDLFPTATTTETEDDRLDAEAMAAYRAGQFVRHAEVARWLDSWGTPHPLPCPEPDRR